MLGRVIGLLAGLALLAEAYLIWRPQTIGALASPDLGPFTPYRDIVALLAAGVGLVVAVAAVLRAGRPSKGPAPVLDLARPDEPFPAKVLDEPQPVAPPAPQAETPVTAAAEEPHPPALDPFPAADADHAPVATPVSMTASAPEATSGPSFQAAMDAGDQLRVAGHLDDALEPYSDAVTLARAGLRGSPDDPPGRRDLASALTAVGDVYDREGRLDAAIDAHQESLDLRRSLASETSGDPAAQRSLSLGLGRLADTREVRGHRSRARDLYRERLPLAERLAGLEPGDPTLAHDLAVTRERLADLDAALAP